MAADHDKFQRIAILDYGSQYTQLIARRIREQQVFSEIIRFDTPASKLRENLPAGIILSGGPNSVFEEGAPGIDPGIFSLGVPILGICYGMQLMSRELGGKVEPGKEREYGKTEMSTEPENVLFAGLPRDFTVWMSHGDRVAAIPSGFKVSATSANCPYAAIRDEQRRFYAIQFHPEVVHTQFGSQIIGNFLFKICGCKADWKLSTWIDDTVARLRGQIGDGEVVLGLSGGVDSSVVAVLLHKAIGRRLHCIFVDNGLLRAGEDVQVETMFKSKLGLDLTVARAAQRFYGALKGVAEPEMKRKIIGREFINVFAEEARKFSHCRFLGQGTIYPDVIESSHALKGPSQTIKSHHNVGGLPPDLKFELVEPLRDLFKDEVRAVGRVLGMDPELLDRQPFPGPGLGVRILGEVTEDKVKLLQEADRRVQEEVRKLPDYKSIWQTFAVLLPVKTVGVMGDQRTYEYTCAIRSVNSIDAMTADWTRLPYDTLATISSRIINEVRGINRVVYDISSKPPATIEWE
ncbi:MAG: glutamine-hydrolyzing GMP synthase [Kiritimatiellae bacterium]|nr:glutamine-hydrolyzing GMP synthase [Kiritimatiellia bacterium]